MQKKAEKWYEMCNISINREVLMQTDFMLNEKHFAKAIPTYTNWYQLKNGGAPD
jgi:hypothetical protein